MRTLKAYKTSEVQELVRRANYEGTVEVERLYEGIRMLESRRGMLRVSDVKRLLDSLDNGGVVEELTLYEGLRRLEEHELVEKTLFDIADDMHGTGRSGWPPTGLWPDADQGKQTQEAHVDL